MLMRYSPPAGFELQLLDDLRTKRNEHLLEIIRAHLLHSETFIAPWGVAHIPEIAKEIKKAGFRLDETREYKVIQSRGTGIQNKGAKP